MAAFLHQPANRDIRVVIEEHLSRDVVLALKEGSASVEICWDAANLDGLASLPYHADHHGVVVYPGRPLAKRKLAWFEETLEHDYVGLPASAAVQAMLARRCAFRQDPDLPHDPPEFRRRNARGAGKARGQHPAQRNRRALRRQPRPARGVAVRPVVAAPLRRLLARPRDFVANGAAAGRFFGHVRAQCTRAQSADRT